MPISHHEIPLPFASRPQLPVAAAATTITAAAAAAAAIAVAAAAAAPALRVPLLPLLPLPSLPSLPSGMPPNSWSIGATADHNTTLAARLAAASPVVADLSAFGAVPVHSRLPGCSPQLGASPVASLSWATPVVGTAQGWAAAARAPATGVISAISPIAVALPLFVPLPSDAAAAAQADDEDVLVDVTEGHIAVGAAASLVQDD